jgi:hypothetical protein
MSSNFTTETPKIRSPKANLKIQTPSALVSGEIQYHHEEDDEVMSQKHLDPEKQTPKEEQRISKKKQRPLSNHRIEFNNDS